MAKKAKKEPCPCCGTWICGNCGWRRQRASRFWPGHRCAQCGYDKGKIWAVYHQTSLRIDHQLEWEKYQRDGIPIRIWDVEVDQPTEWGLAWQMRGRDG